MGVRLKTFLLLTIAGIISIVFYVYWYSSAEHKRMEKQFLQLAENYSYAFYAELNSVEERMLQLAMFTANDDQVRHLMQAASAAVEAEGGDAGGEHAAAIRYKLFTHLHSSMEQLQLNFDIVTLHFHLTPGALSFLRFHNPDEMGDRLDAVRPMIVTAGSKQKPVTGLEIGRRFAGIRAAAPICVASQVNGKKKCVGVVEFGTPIDSLLKGLRANRHWLNAAAFLNDASLKQDMVPQTYAKAADTLSITTSAGERLHLSATTSEQIEDFLQLSDVKSGFAGQQNFRFTRAGKVYNAAVLPLDDFTAEHDWKKPAVGRVLIWQDITPRIAQHKENVTSLIWYGVFLFFALEGCIYLGLYIVSSKLKQEIEHQRQLERVSGKALEAVSSLGHVEQQPQLQLNRILQDQLKDAVDQLGAELGMFLSADREEGEFRVLAVSDMLWTTEKSAGKYVQARNKLMQQGYVPLKMQDNILVQAMVEGKIRVLEPSECKSEIIPFLPEGHPSIKNGILIPIRIADTTLGLLVLANGEREFGSKEQIVAKAYAGAAALLMQSDLREVERLSALETARVKEELFRNLNHELRTPLNTINAMGEKLAGTQLDSIQKHRLGQICQATRRLRNLIEEVLLLTGLDTQDKTKMHIEPFRPCAMLASIATEFDTKAQERGIELRYECDKGLPARFNGDSEKIGMLLRQLVGNAIKFSRDAEVLLSMKNIGETPASAVDKKVFYTLRFNVIDHGIGIAKEQQELIFEPFYQCDASRTREYEGAGLGLSVARKFATLLGSRIQFESEIGVGSSFYFDLDLTPSTSGQAEAAKATSNTDTQAENAEERLEAGDEAQLLELLRKLQAPLLDSRPQPCKSIAAELESREWPRPFGPEVDKLIRCMDKYRYPEALDIVEKLRIRLEQNTHGA